MKKFIVLFSMLFVGTLYGQSLVTSGDINKSMVSDYKQFFTKENCNQVLIDTFSICYDWKKKSATAVYVEVTGENVVKDIDKRPPFFTDKRVKKQYRTTSKDYTKSGYDRGHFGASDASHDWNKRHQKATYSMANIVPQTPRANRYKFIALEQHEREMAVKHGRLENVTLAYWNAKPKTIGKSKLHVPSAFAKIFTGKNYRECFFIWNTEKYDEGNGQDPNKYKVPCDDVFKMWGTEVGEVDAWSVADSKELKRLLKKLADSAGDAAGHIKHMLMMVP